MAWEITSITDRGAGHHCRFQVEGLNTEHRIPQPFCWSVRDVADERYVAGADASDAVRAALAAAKVASAPAGTVCLACGREACAQAGYPGIDLQQPGHTCSRYTIDGDEVDLDDFIRANTVGAEEAGVDGLSPDQVQEIRHMMPGDTLHLGGGAGEIFTLTRTR